MPQTTFADVLCDYALVQIDDVRLNKQMLENPARFFRKMSLYMLNAIPRFNRPPEVREWLKFTAPSYDDFQHIPEADMAAGDTLATDVTGYGMASGVITAPDGYGGIGYTPIAMEYNGETGVITLNQAIPAQTQLDFDFYNDGVFDRELGEQMKRILGLCVQVVWENRFANAFLLQQPKIRDKSFDTGNEANQMRAATERLKALNAQLNSEMHQFEQAICYQDYVLGRGGIPLAVPGGGKSILEMVTATQDDVRAGKTFATPEGLENGAVENAANKRY